MSAILTLNNSYTLRYRIAELVIEFLKVYLVIKPLQFLFKERALKSRLELKDCPENSVGRDIYNLLERENLNVIPLFEEHDLKHIVLNYGITTEEEIRMQAFLFGNGNRSIFCILFLSSGILMPSVWGKFYEDYKKGKRSPGINKLRLKNCRETSAKELRKIYSIAANE